MKKATKILAPAFALGMIFGATSFSASAASETVEKGDTLWGIAQDHENLTVADLLKINPDLHPTAIPIGTKIQLNQDMKHETNKDIVTHTVQPDNTLYEIAQVYDGATLETIYNLNEGIDPYSLPIGSEVIVANNNSNDSSNKSDVIYHTVQPGNTFYEIANVYDGVTVNDIIAANSNVDIFSLTIGSKISIPLK